jgi:hypothetical protein
MGVGIRSQPRRAAECGVVTQPSRSELAGLPARLAWSVSSERASTLGAQIEQLDRLLYDVQAELVPDREPRPTLVTAAIPDPPAPAPPPPPEPPPIPEPPAPPPPAPGRQMQALTELSERLVASMRELLAGYERVLVPTPRQRPGPAAAVTVSAGPFANIEALHEFEEALSHVPGVRDVAVRGYEGTDRAIIDVRLA